jgi:two-component system, NarL family, response regulator DevR
VAATIVVVDDHEVVREGIRAALERAAGHLHVVGEAASAADARQLVEQTRPDVAIVDVVLPDGDGIQLCREIRARHPDTACVLLSSFTDPRGRLAAALADASAYLPKETSTAMLATTVSAVAAGERPLAKDMIPDMLDDLTSDPGEDPRMTVLTGQERRVFELIGQGLSNRQIARELHLAERTVKNYSSRMLTKLHMERRTEMAVLSARLSERAAQHDARRDHGWPRDS